jgi:chromosome segregation ATPase
MGREKQDWNRSTPDAALACCDESRTLLGKLTATRIHAARWKALAKRYWERLDHIYDATPERDQLRAEVETLSDELSYTQYGLKAELEHGEKLEAEVERLRAALRRYGQHLDDCHSLRTISPEPACTCGLDEVLRVE